MKFKTQHIESEFYTGGIHHVIIWTLNVLDNAFKVYKFAHDKSAKELVVTDLLRDNPASYHSKGQAVDVRTKDWDIRQTRITGALLDFLNRMSHGRVQHEFEPNERFPNADPHVHIEYDDGSIKKEQV